MTINLADNDPRISYSVAQGVTQTSFAVPFEFFADADLNVYVDGTLKTLTTDYTVTGGDGSTGTVSISVTGATGGSTVVITRDIALERTTDFPTSGPFDVVSLNSELDKQIAMIADLQDKADRALQVEDYDTEVSFKLPLANDRKGKTLAFNETTGAVEAGPSIADVQTVSAASADIATLADIEDGTDATDAIQTVAGISSNVTTVAGIASNVSTVAGIQSDVTAVAADATDIGTVATNIASVNTVAGNISDVIAVANDLNEAVSEVETVANDLNEAVSEIETVAASISNVDTVGTNIANVNTVAGNNSNVTTVAGISANVTTVAGISGNVTTVAGISSDVTTVAADGTDIGTVATNIANVNSVAGNATNINNVAGNATNINTVAGISADVTTVAGDSADIQAVAADATDIGTVSTNIANVNTVAGSIANVNTTAANITGVNSFAERYRVGATDPTTSLDEGDLFFNTTDNTYKFYDGSSWQTVNVSGIGSVLDDATPQLGGNLDLNNSDITGTGDINITGTVTAQLLDLGTNNPRIRFDDSDTSNNGEITLDNTALRIEADEDNAVANSKISFRVDGVEKAFINSSGLDVTGSIEVGDGHTIGDDANDNLTLTSSTGENIKFDTAGGTTLFFENGSEVARISSGRLGLGTTSPSVEFEIASSAPQMRITDTDTNAVFQINASSTNGGVEIQADATDVGSNPFMAFDVGGSEKVRIRDNGNVGIGTSSPTSPLHVETTSQRVGTFISTGADPQVYIGDAASSDNAFVLGYDRADNRGYLTVAGDSDSVFTIANGGNVGIGTSSPSTALDVNGTVTATSLKADTIQNTSGGAVTLTNQVAAKMFAAANGDTTILGSFGLSSITDNGNGDNTYTMTSAMSDAYYSISALGRSDDNANARMAVPCLTSHRAVPTTTVINLAFHYDNTNRRETDHETISVIGDLA